MLEYFLLTALANLILSYYLLHIVKESSATTFANRWGVLHFYIVTILTGWFVIPLVMFSIVCALITKK